MGVMVRYRKVSIPEFGIDTEHYPVQLLSILEEQKYASKLDSEFKIRYLYEGAFLSETFELKS